MIFILGRKVKITEERVCRRSGVDHLKLVHEARISRLQHGFKDIDLDYVLCMRCGFGLSLDTGSLVNGKPSAFGSDNTGSIPVLPANIGEDDATSFSG